MLIQNCCFWLRSSLYFPIPQRNGSTFNLGSRAADLVFFFEIARGSERIWLVTIGTQE